MSVSHENCSPNVERTTKRSKIELEDEDKRKEANLTANKLLSTMFFQTVPTNELSTKNAGQFLTDMDTVSLAVLRVSVWWQSAYCNCATLQVQGELMTYMTGLNNFGNLVSDKMLILKEYDNEARVARNKANAQLALTNAQPAHGDFRFSIVDILLPV